MDVACLGPGERTGVTGKGAKPIIKIWKLNLRLLQRRETVVQRAPQRDHFLLLTMPSWETSEARGAKIDASGQV